MTDIVDQLTAAIEQGENFDPSQEDLMRLLFHARHEIKTLRRQVSDMGWQLNPDRMGGQFTDEELGRDGWL